MNTEDDKAPLLGSWTAWYVLVLFVLFECFGDFYCFTKHFS